MTSSDKLDDMCALEKEKTTEMIEVPKNYLHAYMHYANTPDALRMDNNFIDAETFRMAQQFKIWIGNKLLPEIK